MRRPRRPLFLAPTPYRRRRMRDAARLLPALGAFLCIVPMLWSPLGEGLRRLSGDVFYFFAVWVLLIGLAAGFAPGLSQGADADDEDED